MSSSHSCLLASPHATWEDEAPGAGPTDTAVLRGYFCTSELQLDVLRSSRNTAAFPSSAF